MNEENLIKYYNKFNEDKRLKTHHGRVEYMTAMKYIEKFLKKYDNPSILDIGAGCGAYSIPLSEKANVTALELVKHNLKVIEKKDTLKKVKLVLGNATNLSRFKDNSFDIVLLFGPMYHLISMDDKLKALIEAKRVLKENGLIFISYCMNEYAVITHGFKDGFIMGEMNKLDKHFKIISNEDDLYSYVRLEDINYLKKKSNLKRVKIVSQDGPTEYLKKEINSMSNDEFNIYLRYHYSICERKELLGSSRHVLDILKKQLR